MSALPFVMLAVVLLSLGAQPSQCSPQPPPKTADPQPSPPKRDPVVQVEIVVQPLFKELSALCTTNTPATTIFVENSKPVQVYHCIGTKLHNHTEHFKNPKAMDPADVKLSFGQRVRWVSTTPFFVVDVTKPEEPDHQPQDRLAPLRPFGVFKSEVYATQVETPEVPDVAGEKPVVQRYKVTFNIQNIGLVDPDLICTM